jgi:hypothetical protein
MSMLNLTYKNYPTARAFLRDGCSDNEITMLLEGGVITMEEGDSIYDAEFEGTDEELSRDILELRTHKYTLQFVDDRNDGYFIVGRL